mmetsp:Transcript_102376/g.330298  ORF Transcript_102376/g.330298 Transcript_102376/m.330298 type:complete len:204 (+) Transcript_102376:191-802(+)
MSHASTYENLDVGATADADKDPLLPTRDPNALAPASSKRVLPSSAGGAHRAARARGAVRHVAVAAAGPEAAHHVGTGALASGRCLLALLDDIACGVEGRDNVTIRSHDMVRGPAVATASGVFLQLKGRRARVLTALHLGACRCQGRLAKAVLCTVLHVQPLLLRGVPAAQHLYARALRGGQEQQKGRDHSLHCVRGSVQSESW